MMPRPLSNVLRRMVAGAALAVVVVFCLFWPARQVLAPLWPVPVEEVLMADDDAETAERRLLTQGRASLAVEDVVARNRPITLWRLELHSGEIVHAWMQGVRERPGGELSSPLPDWLEPARVDAPLPGAGILVLLEADRRQREMPADEVKRMYRPNGLDFGQRLALARDRFHELWRWPFSATSDA